MIPNEREVDIAQKLLDLFQAQQDTSWKQRTKTLCGPGHNYLAAAPTMPTKSLTRTFNTSSSLLLASASREWNGRLQKKSMESVEETHHIPTEENCEASFWWEQNTWIGFSSLTHASTPLLLYSFGLQCLRALGRGVFAQPNWRPRM